MRRFENKVAIVTGGASGIGLATVQRLSAEGATVVAADINLPAAQDAVAKLDGPGTAIWFDAEQPETIKSLVEETVQRHGRLDVLHNNAALLTPEASAADTTATDIDLGVWDRVFAVNLRGYVAACKFAIPHMVAAGGGAIVNSASGTGLGGDVSRIAYGTSKGGVMTLTKYLATQYGAQGVRANAIAIGLIGTPALEAVAPWLAELVVRQTLVGRLGKPEDIAAMVAFLASDDASYVTGQTVNVDGGFFAHLPYTADMPTG